MCHLITPIKSHIEELVCVYCSNSVKYHHVIILFLTGFFPLSPGAKSWMCLLISSHTLSALLWKGRSSETNFGDFCLLSAHSCLVCHSRELQKRKRFHFKALRPSLQTPFILSWMSRTDAPWKARAESRPCQRPKSFLIPVINSGPAWSLVPHQYQNFMWPQV